MFAPDHGSAMIVSSAMEHRVLGGSGLAISAVGLGGVELCGGDTSSGGPTLDEATAAVEAAIDAGVNWIDTAESYYDYPDDTGVPLEETWGAMTELVDAGRVRAIGLSNYEMNSVEGCNAQRLVDVVQDGLSLVDHLDNRKSFARCGELGIGVVVYEPPARSHRLAHRLN